jgi:hypothetical protein
MKHSTKNILKNSIKAVLFLAVVVTVFCMEEEDARVADQQYCENVKDNTWPNYKDVDLSTFCN